MKPSVRGIVNLLSKGWRNPNRIPPYIKRQTGSGISRLHDKVCQFRHPNQTTRLDEFRKSDSWALIILDACRYDRFEKIAPEYFDMTLEPIAAAEGDTFGYLRECWPGDHQVKYVSGAAPVTSQRFNWDEQDVQADGLIFEGDDLREMYQEYIPADHISDIIEVWRESWDESLGVCPPEPVTDRSIKMASEAQYMVTHYFQPHEPYIGNTQLIGNIKDAPDRLEGGAIGGGIWSDVRSGEISNERLFHAYDDNLHRVLAETVLLMSKIGDEFDNIVIMGDHGEALGEYGQYKHSIRHPKVRVVPWANINDVDEKKAPSRKIGQRENDKKDGSSVEDRLKELGYL